MKKLFYIAALAAALSACDYLNEEPYHYVKEEDVFNIEARYNQPCFEAYRYMFDGYNCCGGAFLDAATDDAMATVSGSAIHRLAWGYLSEDNTIYSPWTNCYRGIHQCIFAQNGFDKYNTQFAGKTPKEVADLKEQFYHEMNALRAYYEFTLLQFYAGFPIVDKAYTLSDEAEVLNKGRNSFSECVEHIVALCDTAAAHLYTKPHNDNAMLGNMTKGAAMAIKAKTLVYAASPLYNQAGNDNPLIGYTATDVPADYPTVADRWKRAAAACADVLNLRADGSIVPGSKFEAGGNSLYTLVACGNATVYNSTTLFTGNATVKEWIVMKTAEKNYSLENRHYPPSLSNNSGGGTVPTQELVNAFCKSDGSYISEPANGEATVYTGRDRRFQAYIGYNGAKYGSRTLYTRTGDGATKDAIGATTDLSTTTGYYMMKFLNPTLNFNSTPNTQFHIWPVIRIADIILLYSEAMALGYDSFDVDPQGYGWTAKEAIQLLRKRSGFPVATDKYFDGVTTTAQFIDKVKRERRIELCFEGQRYHDLRRWMDAETVLNKPVHGLETNVSGGNTTYTYFVADQRRAFTKAMYLHPIPKSVLKVNTKIKQNPGY